MSCTFTLDELCGGKVPLTVGDGHNIRPEARMIRRTVCLTQLWAVGLLGCCGGDDTGGDNNLLDQADSSAVEAHAPADSGKASSATEPDTRPADPTNGEPDTTQTTIADAAARQQTQWLRDMASHDPKTLAAAKEHFNANYDDNGWQIFSDNLDHADVQVRRGAVYGVYTLFDPANEKLLETVQTLLADDDAVVRHVALTIMNSPSFPRQQFLDAIENIAKHLDHTHEPDTATRAQVARMLAKYKTEAQPALPALNSAVRNDPQHNVRSASLQAIYHIARNAEEALPAPMHVLSGDPDPRLRRVAARRLGSYKAAAAPTIPTLINSLKDLGMPARAANDPLRGTDEPVCIAAADALSRIGKPAVPALIKVLPSENQHVRLLAIRALGNIGPPATAAIPTLQKLAQSSDNGQNTAAKAALMRIRRP